MRWKDGRWGMLGAVACMLCLIVDSRCAFQGALDALNLCLKTVIPSLFPMFVLSGLIVSGIHGGCNPLVRLLERLIGVPEGTGVIFLMGLIGGFPVGAQCIAQGVSEHGLSKADGERMLGFCNNCSPGFLFGILGSIFSGPSVALWVWLVQLVSALLVAMLWPGHPGGPIMLSGKQLSLSGAVWQAVRSMCSVCAWIMLAGVVNAFLERWIFPLLPSLAGPLLQGLLELTSGVLGLGSVENGTLRWIACCVFVCFGGGCVLFQIQSIAATAELSVKACIQQKFFQAAMAFVLAVGATAFGLWTLLFPLILVLVWKKVLEKSGCSMYNSIRKGGF